MFISFYFAVHLTKKDVCILINILIFAAN